MPSRFVTFFLLFIAATFFLPVYSSAQIPIGEYGLTSLADHSIIEKKLQHHLDSLYQQSLFFAVKETPYSISKERPWQNKTPDFYILLGLILLLGIIRFLDPKYLNGLWGAYLNSGFSGRAHKDKVQQSTFPNVLMNIFFVFALGCYVFYVFQNMADKGFSPSSSGIAILALVSGVAIIYFIKYLVIRFSGWAFDMKGVTDTYLFNVFLVNKVMAVALIPFTIVMAFQSSSWSSIAIVLSFIVILALFISRYVKSWQVLGSFFHYSKFHFFTYLCASEIMPLAVLTKFLLAFPF